MYLRSSPVTIGLDVAGLIHRRGPPALRCQAVRGAGGVLEVAVRDIVVAHVARPSAESAREEYCPTFSVESIPVVSST
jgi:hypothetical protein